MWRDIVQSWCILLHRNELHFLQHVGRRHLHQGEGRLYVSHAKLPLLKKFKTEIFFTKQFPAIVL